MKEKWIHYQEVTDIAPYIHHAQKSKRKSSSRSFKTLTKFGFYGWNLLLVKIFRIELSSMVASKKHEKMSAILVFKAF